MMTHDERAEKAKQYAAESRHLMEMGMPGRIPHATLLILHAIYLQGTLT